MMGTIQIRLKYMRAKHSPVIVPRYGDRSPFNVCQMKSSALVLLLPLVNHRSSYAIHNAGPSTAPFASVDQFEKLWLLALRYPIQLALFIDKLGKMK